jgi:ribose-phosphate pyrophosphokinase
VTTIDTSDPTFLTPERFARQQAHRMVSPRGRLVIASCAGGSYMARSVVDRYAELMGQAGSGDRPGFLEDIDRRFSDGEVCVRLAEHVGGADVFLFQALFDPTGARTIDENYMSLLMGVRALVEHGARHVVGVVPYLAYARQDKPTKFTREATGARLMADLAVTAGLSHLITWQPHSDQLRGFYGTIPATMLESLSLFAAEYERFRGRDDVIVVAPDPGASKDVTHFGHMMGLRCAVGAKHRPKPEVAVVTDIIGDFAGKRIALVLDDMISNAGTMFAVVRKLVEEKGIEEVYVGASHNVCVGKARERLEDLHVNCNLREVIVTNSIPQTDEFRELGFVKVRCLSDAFARTINRTHYNRSISEVFSHAE